MTSDDFIQSCPLACLGLRGMVLFAELMQELLDSRYHHHCVPFVIVSLCSQ